MTDECIERAKADIEATGESSSDRRLRAAFGGERAPTVEIAAGETFGDWLIPSVFAQYGLEHWRE